MESINMGMFAKIIDHDHLVRDLSTQAILNTDKTVIKKHEIRMRELQKEQERCKEIEKLHDEISEIKSLLNQLVTPKSQ